MNALLPSLLLALVPQGQEGTYLRDVRIVDLEEGRVVEGQSIAIEGQRITAVGPARTLQPAEGARVVEGGGRYVLPGLCDMHVHLHEPEGEDSLLLFVANGVTTVQSMHGSPWHLALRGRIARGEVLGPRVFTTGPTTAQLRVRTPAQAERVAREQKAAGYDAIKMYGDGSNSMTRETYRALIATAHAVGMRVVGHAPRNLPFAAVLEEHQDSIDHMEEIVYTDAGLGRVVKPYVDLQFGALRFDDHPELLGEVPDFRPPLAGAVTELAAKVKAAGLAITPTLVTFATIQQTTDDAYFALLKRPELVYVPSTVRSEWAPDHARFRNGGWKPHLAFMARSLQRNAELQSALLAAFAAAGVPVMTGTDAPFDFVVPGFALHDELAAFVAAGLTPLAALRAATSVPASVLGIAAEAGSIAPGKVADLVLLEENPLADVGATRRNAGVFLRGRWLAPEELRAKLDALVERNAALEERVAVLAPLIDGARVAEALAALGAKAGRDPRLADWFETRVDERGHEHLRKKELDAALALLRANTEAFPDSANAWDGLGEVCRARGEVEEALRHYERAVELDPDSESGRKAIDELVEELAALPAGDAR